MKGKLAIFSLFIVTLLSSCSNNTYKSSENTCHLYRTKINNVSQDENGNWVVKGVTGAPNGAKILVSNSDKDSLQYRENGAKSISKETFPKVKNKKFKCIVDPTIICDLNQDNKEGKRVKVLSFAITNYHKKWTTTEIPLKAIKIAKKHIRTQVLTISKSQEDYYNSFGKEDKSSNNNYSISNGNIVPTSDYPNITDEFDISNMLQYSDEDLYKGVTIKNFYVKDVGADKLKDYHLLLTPKKNSNQYFLVVTDKLKKKIQLGDTISAQGMLNGSSHINKTQVNCGISENYLNNPVTLLSVDKIEKD